MTTAKKKAESKPEVSTPPTTASAESPAPPLVASYDQLKEAAAEATPTPKKKG